MRGERGAVFKNFLLNPLVWVAVVLSYMTVSNAEDGKVWSVFFSPVMYRNLFIGCALYVVFWERKYTDNGQRLDISETLKAVFEVMANILFFWAAFLLMYLGVHSNGERYRQELERRYQQSVHDNSEEVQKGTVSDMLEEMENYQVIANEDGSITVKEVHRE